MRDVNDLMLLFKAIVRLLLGFTARNGGKCGKQQKADGGCVLFETGV